MSGLSVGNGLQIIVPGSSNDYPNDVWGDFCKGIQSKSITEEMLQHVIFLLSEVIKKSRIEPERVFARRKICAIIQSAADCGGYRVICMLIKERGFIQREMSQVSVSDFCVLRRSINSLCYKCQSEWDTLFKARSLDLLESFQLYFPTGKKWETTGKSSPMVLMLSSGEINEESEKMTLFLLGKFPRDFLYMQIDGRLVPFWAYLTHSNSFSLNILRHIFEKMDPRLLSASISIQDQKGQFFIEHSISDRFYGCSSVKRHESILPLLNRIFDEKSSVEIIDIIQELCNRDSPWTYLIMKHHFRRFLGELSYVQDRDLNKALTSMESIIPFLSPEDIGDLMMSLDQSIFERFKQDSSLFSEWGEVYSYLNFVSHVLNMGNGELIVMSLFSLNPKAIAMIVPVLTEGLLACLLPWIEINDDFRNYCTKDQNDQINNYLFTLNNTQPSEEEISFA